MRGRARGPSWLSRLTSCVAPCRQADDARRSYPQWPHWGSWALRGEQQRPSAAGWPTGSPKTRRRPKGGADDAAATCKTSNTRAAAFNPAAGGKAKTTWSQADVGWGSLQDRVVIESFQPVRPWPSKEETKTKAARPGTYHPPRELRTGGAGGVCFDPRQAPVHVAAASAAARSPAHSFLPAIPSRKSETSRRG